MKQVIHYRSVGLWWGMVVVVVRMGWVGVEVTVVYGLYKKTVARERNA